MKIVLNIQDIYPRAAISMGVLKNRHAIRVLEFAEKRVYRAADHIVVISDGFRHDLLAKDVPADKLTVIRNWADPSFIRPEAKENSFRRELNVNGSFAVVYSGGLTHNSELETLLAAAVDLKNDPFCFVIVGDGVRKEELQRMAAEYHLTNVIFKPFQPLERYPEVLAAADLNVVTLSREAASVSVPSKVFKQMAAGRPILAITPPGTELCRMIQDAKCGFTFTPGETTQLVKGLRWALNHPDDLGKMGHSARAYLEKHHSRAQCTLQIESVLSATLTRTQT